MKKLFSIFSVALFAVVLLCMNSVTVAAEEPTTYHVKYDSKTDSWLYETETMYREIYYMLQEIKDGDLVVVDATEEGWPTLELDYHLSNLTILPYSSCMVTVKSIDECYVLHDSFVSITADVNKGWVYGNAACNFNLDCDYLELFYEDEPEMSVGVLGNCSEFLVHSDASTKYHLWNFTDDIVFNDGVLKTAYGSYSIEPPAASTSAPSATTSPNSTTTTSSSSSDEYDDVPKTGESVAYLWMFAIAALCFTGSYSLKKKD